MNEYACLKDKINEKHLHRLHVSYLRNIYINMLVACLRKVICKRHELNVTGYLCNTIANARRCRKVTATKRTSIVV